MVQPDLHFVCGQGALDGMEPVAGIAHHRLVDHPPVSAANTCNDRGVRLVTSPHDNADFTVHQANEASGWIQPKDPKHGGARGIR
jgi:hypothetical protein